MFFFNPTLLPFLIIGLAWLLFARPIVNFIDERNSLNWPKFLTNFSIWIFRIMGITAICFFIYMGINRPYTNIKNDNNAIIGLLEGGKIVEGKVLERWYDNWAPTAWMIFYSFEAPNPKEGKSKIYYGKARGPKHYYASLAKGNTVAIIYNSANPKINSEMYEFLNFPGYHRIFKLEGKSEMLNKFQDKYHDKFETYSLLQWYEESKQK
jgi:hypothetical protein